MGGEDGEGRRGEWEEEEEKEAKFRNMEAEFQSGKQAGCSEKSGGFFFKIYLHFFLVYFFKISFFPVPL